jgi:sugar O-acyltransferase (sialic acid O-acetyltransferase NeuD family)
MRRCRSLKGQIGMKNDPVLVIGAGGHGKVVIGTLQAAGFTIASVFDDDQKKWGSEILGVRVNGPVSDAPKFGSAAVIGLGLNRERQRISTVLDLIWVTAIHPRAWVHPSTVLGDGTVVFAGATVQPDTVIGRHSIVNTGATIDHDCAIGDFAHIAPGASLAGGVHLGTGAFMGTGSCAIPGVRIGEWTTVGAGAAVVRNLPSGVVAVGLPATPREGKGNP